MLSRREFPRESSRQFHSVCCLDRSERREWMEVYLLEFNGLENVAENSTGSVERNKKSGYDQRVVEF